MRKYLSRGAAVAVLGAAVMAIGTAPVHALDSPTGGTVTVRALPQAGMLRVEVGNQGPGVPADYQQAIFEK